MIYLARHRVKPTDYVVDPETGCWLWQLKRDRHGYGRVRRTGRGEALVQLAHRWVYEELVGPIPEGLVIDHLCRNPPCVNPKHLEPVTPGENFRRGTRGSHLKPDDVRAIRTSTDSCETLATRYMLTVPAIWKIRARQRWADIPDDPSQDVAHACRLRGDK